MKTKLKNLSFILVILISLSSCDDIWVNPISDVQDAKIDERLIGTWTGKDAPDSTGIIHIYQIDQHSVYVYLVNPESRCETFYSEAHISEVDGRTFMNLRYFDCNHQEFWRYGIDEYEFNGEDEVIFYDINKAFVKEAIEDKRLSGDIIVVKDTFFGSERRNIVVTATSQEIREFIKNSPKEELFKRDNLFIYKRFKRPKDTKRSICILF